MEGGQLGFPNKEFRKGLLGMIILHHLSVHPSYPYAMLKNIQKLKHPMLRGMTKSDLYNSINSFEKNGLIRGKVMTKGSKLQKYYELTPKGRKIFKVSSKIVFKSLAQIRKIMRMETNG